MRFSFTSLGNASATPTVDRFPSAHVLNVHERLFLIDCGEGCQIQLKKYGFSLLKIREIFISHIHGDHIFGLLGLFSSMSMMGRRESVDIYAPAGLSPLIKFYSRYFGEESLFEINHIKVKCNEPTLIYENKKVEIFAFPLRHRVECYGYFFKEKSPKLNVHKHLIDHYSLSLYEIARLKEGSDVVRESGEILECKDYTYLPYKARSFAYCSDTAPFEELQSYIKGVSLLYHESTFGSEMESLAKETLHSTAADAARGAKEAGADMLLLGHFSARYKNVTPLIEEARAIFPNSFEAVQGIEFEIPLTKPTK